jgi:hypothetical protein
MSRTLRIVYRHPTKPPRVSTPPAKLHAVDPVMQDLAERLARLEAIWPDAFCVITGALDDYLERAGSR